MPETFIVLRSQTGCESAAEQVRAAPLPLKIRSDAKLTMRAAPTTPGCRFRDVVLIEHDLWFDR